MMNEQAASKPIDKWIPWMFVLFFVVIAVLDGIFVTLAVRTHTGTVSDRAYEDGLAYNDTLDRAEKMAALGWSADIALDGGALVLTLKDKDGAPLDGAEAVAKLTRPVQDGIDFETVLQGVGSGVYRAPVSFPLPGQWQVRIFASWQGRLYQHSRTIMVP